MENVSSDITVNQGRHVIDINCENCRNELTEDCSVCKDYGWFEPTGDLYKKEIERLMDGMRYIKSDILCWSLKQAKDKADELLKGGK